MEKYSFGEAANQINVFWLDNFCDVYIEMMKPIMRSSDAEAKKAVQNVLYYCMDRGLRLMHPFMPFLTEELYQRLPHPESNRSESICIAEYPTETFWVNNEIEGNVNKLLEVSHSILSVLSQFKIDRSKPRVCIYSDKITTDLFNQEKLVISTLGKTGEIFVTTIKNDKTGLVGPKNGQSGLVRNEGIKLVKTEWIGFLDDDDSLEKDYVDTLFKKYSKHDFVVWRMKYENGMVLPPFSMNDLVFAHVGISFCYNKNIFADV